MNFYNKSFRSLLSVIIEIMCMKSSHVYLKMLILHKATHGSNSKQIIETHKFAEYVCKNDKQKLVTCLV